jgi:hypothetical protein
VDATITYRSQTNEVGVYAHEDEAYDHDNYFKVYQPQMNDHGYVCAEDEELCLLTPDPITVETVAWWRLSCGRVLGVVNGMMLEFDKSTLAPLGLVVSGDELLGRQVAIVDSGLQECMINFEDDGMDGADCADGSEEIHREQAVLVFDDDGVTIVQPNEDGGFVHHSTLTSPSVLFISLLSCTRRRIVLEENRSQQDCSHEGEASRESSNRLCSSLSSSEE